MRRALRDLVVALVSVVGLAGVTGCGASHTATVVNATNVVDRTATTAAATPILAGPWASYQEGYGHVRPRTVYNGGDALGRIRNIEWLSWGGSRAVGVGISPYLAPKDRASAEAEPESAVIVLFRLGTCHGRSAYNAVQWYFPQYGEHFNPHQTGYKLCV